MIVIGAKGMAKELAEVLSIEMKLTDSELRFFDNVSQDIPELLFNRFVILRDFDAVSDFLKDHTRLFTLGLGNPYLRQKMANKFLSLGGELTSIISQKAQIGSFNTKIGVGSQIMQGVIITNDVTLGKGVLVNVNSSISHDTTIGDYCEIACGVTIPGRCKIGNFVFIGSNTTLNPDITVGDNSVIGSGAVVIENVPANAVVVGNPAKVIKRNE